MTRPMQSLALTALTLCALASAAQARQMQPQTQSQADGMADPSMRGMPGMGDHGMGGMTMDDMMKQCSRMRADKNMTDGKPMSASMAKMMAQCRHMDSQTMPAPSATLDR